MKKIIFALAVVGAFLTGCNSNGSKANGADEVGGKDQANEIIGFYNDALEASRNYNKNVIERGVDYLEDADEYVQKTLKNNSASSPIFIDTYHDFGDKSKATPSDAFGDKKEVIAKDFSELKKHAEEVKKLLSDIKSHLESEDFKDDKGAKFAELKQKAEAEIEGFQQVRTKLFGEMDSIVEKAEGIILEDHPLKENILSSKKLLAVAGEFIDEVVAQSEAEKVNVDKLDAAYKAIETQLANNQKIEVKDASAKSNYERLNKEGEDYLGALRKFIRDTKEKKKFDQNGFNQVDSAYQSLVSAYNSFVN
ncbi:DUF3829 domain-containing protein [Capnocytophaga leadbetteri]|jgi:hypothetical protein|uniref:DUF3829 domain-containing protein n=1 Tax=Capnocytophaga leadbetteri TaxID=327575 RepID=UPI002889008F|nr:DUF3829 domain-containing protein [Capnocytophaga leadbetteri]